MRRVLFDHSVPRPLSRHLPGVAVETAQERGWDTLTNGKLLQAIESAGFNVFLTCDQNLRYQQNLTGLNVAIVVIGTNLWPVIAANPYPIAYAIDAAMPGTVSVVPYPKPPRPQFSPL